MARQMNVGKNMSARGMYQEERPSIPLRLNSYQSRMRRCLGTRAKNSREMLDSRSLKHRSQRNSLAQTLFYQGEQTNCSQGMSAELKEVVRHADRTNAQNLFPQTNELSFQRIARRHELLSRIRLCATRIGQRAAVNLPIGHQRQSIDRYKDRRHQIVGQLLLQKDPQLASRRL